MPSSPARIALLSVLGWSTLLSGCGGGSGSRSSTPTPPAGPTQPASTPANSFYGNTVNDAFYPPQPSTILQFSRTAHGAASPVATITGPKNTVFGAMAVGPSGNLYVAGQIPGDPSKLATPAAISTTEILVYAPGVSGTAAPTEVVTLGGVGTFNNFISGLDVDLAGNLYVSTSVAIGSGPSGRVYLAAVVYSAVNGTLTSARSIVGDSTGIASNSPIAADAAGDVFVAGGVYNSGSQSVLMFSPTASGNIAPTAAISGSSTGISSVRGLAVDRSGNLYVLSGDSVLEFAPGASGNVAPIRTITNPQITSDTIGGSIRVDAAGNIYVFGTGTDAEQTILVYPPTASGTATPVATITSTSYVLPGFGLALQR